jgi:hypothetical protein
MPTTTLHRTSIATFTTTRFEPCDRFTPDAAGAPVCCDCGWLDEEHPAST